MLYSLDYTFTYVVFENHLAGIVDSRFDCGKLNQHLEEIDRQANEMMETLTAQMAKQEGVNESLKAENQMKWVGLMNNIQAAAEEIVLKELVYR